MEKIYFDYAATTPIRQEILDVMLPYFTEHYGNPSSIYGIARSNKKALEKAREKTASALGAAPEEIYFTGSGTESDNWAIRGIAEQYKSIGKHIITSAIEHHAVIHTCEYLEKQHFQNLIIDFVCIRYYI